MRLSRRNGMAMIMAIIVIVVMSTIMALSISLTTDTTKRTKDLYLYEQTVLLSKSATEYALLQIAQRQPCSPPPFADLNFQQNTFYDVNIRVEYIYYDDPATVAVNEAQTLCAANGGTLYTWVTTPEQNGSVVLDIAVGVPKTSDVTTEPIRYFRRTIQKL